MYVCEECQLRDAIITDAQVTESSGQLVSSQLTALRICYSTGWREHGMFAAANCQLYRALKNRNRWPIFLYHGDFLRIFELVFRLMAKLKCIVCYCARCCFVSRVTGTFARMRFHNGTLNTPSLIMSVSQTESNFHYDSNNAFGTPLDESCSRTMSYGRLVCTVATLLTPWYSLPNMCRLQKTEPYTTTQLVTLWIIHTISKKS